jgi:hypothetical protein
VKQQAHDVIIKLAGYVVCVAVHAYIRLSDMQVMLDNNEVWNSLSRYGR